MGGPLFNCAHLHIDLLFDFVYTGTVINLADQLIIQLNGLQTGQGFKSDVTNTFIVASEGGVYGG